ncbi:MAG: hypothetical protein KC587_17955, partial [Nitrospira sp.]|nr:hypothetical protein [Nitrospira sp.]
MILDAVSTASPHVTPHVSPQVGELLRVVHDEISRDDLQAALGLSGRKSFRERYLKPALAFDDGPDRDDPAGQTHQQPAAVSPDRPRACKAGAAGNEVI